MWKLPLAVPRYLQGMQKEERKIMNKLLIVLGIIFVVANITDGLLTWLIVDRGGFEFNPIMAFVIEGGFWKLVAFKVSISAGAALFLIWKQWVKSLVILAMFFIVIVAWNAYGLCAI